MIDIYKLLRAKGLRYNSSIEEYTDHFSSMYEDLADQHCAEQAKIYVQVAINRLDTKQVNKDYFNLHYKNKFIMTSTIMATLSLLICIFMTPAVEDPPTINPIEISSYEVSSHFGMRNHPVKKKKVLHKGIDLKAAMGVEVKSTAAGLVLKAEYDENYGYFIIIKHDEHYTTRYHHLSQLTVDANEKVELGQVIGAVGSSGLSTGPHLHYEVLEDGKHVDPIKYLKS